MTKSLCPLTTLKTLTTMTKHLLGIAMSMLAISGAFAQSYDYKPIKGFQDSTNERLEAFLESTVPMKTRKVAVFDCDGTLFGQAPYYLADEALYDFADRKSVV